MPTWLILLIAALNLPTVIATLALLVLGVLGYGRGRKTGL